MAQIPKMQLQAQETCLNRGFFLRHRLLFHVFSGVFLTTSVLVLPATISGFELRGSWPTNTRDDIRIKYCQCSFDRWLALDHAKTVTGIKNALDWWNIYSQVDFKFRYVGTASGSPYDPVNNPDCADEELGCHPEQETPSNGWIYLRAEENYIAPAATCCYPGCDVTCGTINKCSISFYKKVNGTIKNWTFDHVTGGETFQYILFHELAHDLGMCSNGGGCNDPFGFPWSVLDGDPMARTIWHADLTAIRQTDGWSDPDCHPTTPYYMRQDRYISHKRSTDNGLTWADESDNLQQTTNHKVAVAYGLTINGNKYVLSWVGTNLANNINTIIGDGVSWSYQRTHADRSEFGPALAYGNGLWVLAYAGVDEDPNFFGRRIFFKTSADGYNWSATNEINLGNYGSLGSPVLSYNTTQNRFVLAFVDWRTNQRDETVPYGKIRVCTSASPGTDRFNNCQSLDQFSWNTPGLECRSDGQNYCVITATDYRCINDNQFWNGCGYVDATDGKFYMNGTWVNQVNWTSRAELANTWGNSYYLVGFRGPETLYFSGNTGRKTACNPAWSWGDKRTFYDVLYETGIELVYGTGYGEFAFYYSH